MSRFDGKQNEPDYDRYEPKPVEDIDVPDFDQPDPPVDPAEHALRNILVGLCDLERLIERNDDLDRANVLRKLAADAWQHADDVAKASGSKVDQILERRR